MSIDVRRRGWVQVVQLSDDDPIRQPIEKLLDEGESLIIVDLTRRAALDSVALGQLVACREHGRRHDAAIKLVVTPRQRELVMATKLDELFETFHDEEEALDSFQSRDSTVGIP